VTDAECAETLAEFRLLTLGPRLSEALDHAIGRMTPRTPALVPLGYRMPDQEDGLAA